MPRIHLDTLTETILNRLRAATGASVITSNTTLLVTAICTELVDAVNLTLESVQGEYRHYNDMLALLGEQVAEHNRALQSIAPPEPPSKMPWICYCGTANPHPSTGCIVCDRRNPKA